MEGLKVKFFCFGAYSFANGDNSDPNSGWDLSMPNVNRKINDFLDNGRELVSCQMESICKGNNPPKYGLVVKVSYIEKDKEE